MTGEEVFLFDLGGLGVMPVDQTALSQAGVQLAHGGQNLTADDLPGRLSTLVQEYFWVVLAIPLRPSLLTIKAIDLADVTIQLAETPERWLTQAADAFVPSRKTRTETNSAAGAENHAAAGRIGVVVGGSRGTGTYRGLEVFEQERIPVDLIAASSMGAIVGALYASGTPMEDYTRGANDEKADQFMDRVPDVGPGGAATFGAVARSQDVDYFKKILRNCKFEELETPLSVVTCDVITGEEVMFDTYRADPGREV